MTEKKPKRLFNKEPQQTTQITQLTSTHINIPTTTKTAMPLVNHNQNYTHINVSFRPTHNNCETFVHCYTWCLHFTASCTTGWVNYANEHSQAAFEQSR